MGSTLMRPAFGRFLPLRAPKNAPSELANAMVSPFALTPFTAVMLSMMFALSDDQLALVMTAAGSVPVEKRSVFLERVAARLQLRGPRFNAEDLDRAVQMALRGLVQNSAA
jgi:hypothetical protein